MTIRFSRDGADPKNYFKVKQNAINYVRDFFKKGTGNTITIKGDNGDCREFSAFKIQHIPEAMRFVDDIFHDTNAITIETTESAFYHNIFEI